MRTYIEKALERIHELEPTMSCDIYHDSLKKQFVVKLHRLNMSRHFRSEHIRKSLKMALEWLQSTSSTR